MERDRLAGPALYNSRQLHSLSRRYLYEEGLRRTCRKRISHHDLNLNLWSTRGRQFTEVVDMAIIRV